MIKKITLEEAEKIYTACNTMICGECPYSSINNDTDKTKTCIVYDGALNKPKIPINFKTPEEYMKVQHIHVIKKRLDKI